MSKALVPTLAKADVKPLDVGKVVTADAIKALHRATYSEVQRYYGYEIAARDELRDALAERYTTRSAAEHTLRDTCEAKVQRQQRDLAADLHKGEHDLISEITCLVEELNNLHKEHYVAMMALKERLMSCGSDAGHADNDKDIMENHEHIHEKTANRFVGEIVRRLNQHRDNTVKVTNEAVDTAKRTFRRAAADREKMKLENEKTDEQEDEEWDDAQGSICIDGLVKRQFEQFMTFPSS